MPGVGTTHHVKLGTHYYLLRPGSYTKKSAPMFGARFSTGDPDFNNLSQWQHWGQRCFVGGMDAPLYSDDAMYDDGVGVDTTTHERVSLSRDLFKGAGAGWGIGPSGYRRAEFIVYNEKLFVITTASSVGGTGELWGYTPSTQVWAKNTNIGTFDVRSAAVYDGKLFLGGINTGVTAPVLKYSSGTLASWTTITNPAGIGVRSVDAMCQFQQKLYVAFGSFVWRMKDDQTWDGNTVFYKVNSNSDSQFVIKMVTHLGFLYMLSYNAHVHRTDGNSTFDIWSWDGQTRGVSIRSFDGRLFIMTFEYADNANEGFGVLYQLSGSAVTQLKRWGNPGYANYLGGLTVYDRKLYYGASNLFGMAGRAGFGVAAYDPIEDAHSLIATNSDTGTYTGGAVPYNNFIVEDVFFFQGNMFVVTRGHGIFFTVFEFRDSRPYWSAGGALPARRRYDVTTAGAGVGSQNGGWFTTSTYDAGTHGVQKLWRKVVVDYQVPTSSQSIYVEYSINDGSSWVALGTCNTASARVRKEFFLTATSVAFKLRFTLRSTTNTVTPTLFGFVVSYLPVPEPNWIWTMTLVLDSDHTLLDGTRETIDTEAELAYLSSLWRAHALVPFQDVEGVNWPTAGGEGGTLIYDMTVRIPDQTQPLEAEVTVTLLEAVETY